MLITPSRRHRAALVAAAAVLALLAACTSGSTPKRHLGGTSAAPPSPGPGPAAGRPNIVFVLTDDLSTDLIQYMPHVRALQQAGTSFTKYFVVDSLCCPSRSAIFLGQYPHNTHVYLNTGPEGGYDGFNAAGDVPKTFALSLQRAGYRTAMMGKYLNRYPPKSPPARGWNEWDVTGSEGYREFDYHLNENGHVHYYGKAPNEYLTDVLSRKATQFVATSAEQGRPFALEVASYAPHLPANPAAVDRGTFPTVRAPRDAAFNRLPRHAPGWLGRYGPLSAAQITRIDNLYRKRVEAVQAVDRMIGRLQVELLKRGLLKNTYFVFSSDNGFHMGQRRMMPGKQTAYDTDIRVPLIVAGPGVPAGRTLDTLVSSIDLAPTFEAIAGARSRYPRDGLSLLDQLHGAPAPANWPRAVLVEHREAVNAAGDPDWQTSRSGMPPTYDALRTSDALYVEYTTTGDREYYDLRTDPAELHNIIGTLPAKQVQSLHRMLVSLTSCVGAQCRSRTLPAS